MTETFATPISAAARRLGCGAAPRAPTAATSRPSRRASLAGSASPDCCCRRRRSAVAASTRSSSHPTARSRGPTGPRADLGVAARSRRRSRPGSDGAFFSDVQVAGVHVRVYTAPLDDGRRSQVARPLDDVDATLAPLAVLLAVVEPRRDRARRRARVPGLARRAAPRCSGCAGPPRRSRRPGTSAAGIDADGQGRARRASRAASTRCSTALEALGRRPAPAGRRRFARAPHAARQPPHQRRGARATPTCSPTPSGERPARRRRRAARRADRAGRRPDRPRPRRGDELERGGDGPPRRDRRRASLDRAGRGAPGRPPSTPSSSRAPSWRRPRQSSARSRTCSTTPSSGARRAARSRCGSRAGALSVRDSRPGHRARGPAARLRPLLPLGAARGLPGSGPRPGDRPPGRRDRTAARSAPPTTPQEARGCRSASRAPGRSRCRFQSE